MEETDMKILYLSNTTTRYWPRLHKGFPSVDYVADGLLHGLKSKHSSDVTDGPYKPYMYKSSDINKLDLYGRGFTITKTLDDDESDRNNIEEKIKSKFFDCVIYGSIHRNRDYFDLVTQVYNKDKIALIDGEDDTFLDYSLIDKGVYFKRELLDDSKKLFPISLAFPLEKIQNTNKNKTQAISKNLPSAGGDTWIWTDENDYYSDYYSFNLHYAFYNRRLGLNFLIETCLIEWMYLAFYSTHASKGFGIHSYHNKRPLVFWSADGSAE